MLISAAATSSPAADANILSFGATANDRTDDTDAINRAIAFVANQGGGTVRIPAGRYLINSTGTDNPIRTRNSVRITGDGGRESILQIAEHLKSRAIIKIGDPRYANEANDRILDPTRLQRNVEIDHLGFDLTNGSGRVAIHYRFPTFNVRIHDCEAFQSELERGIKFRDHGGDNHFVNLSCYGLGRNVMVDHNKVSGRIQITAGGGYGIKGLRITNNVVDEPSAYGIALTSVSEAGRWEDIVVEHNLIRNPQGAGILFGEDYHPSRRYSFSPRSRQIARNVRISDNRIILGELSSPICAGIIISNFLTRTANIQISRNTIIGAPATRTTSRAAIKVAFWDFNWSRHTHPHLPTVTGRRLSGSWLRLPNAHLNTGMEVSFVPIPGRKFPAGLEPYRRYTVIRSMPSRFQVASHGRISLRFPHQLSSSAARLIFSPAVENASIESNRIDGAWDFDLLVNGSEGLSITDNELPGRVVFSGINANLKFADNQCTGVARFNGMLSNAVIATNRWAINLPSSFSYPAVISFEPENAQQSQTYRFDGNLISVSNRNMERWPAAIVSDSLRPGSIRGRYTGNRVSPTEAAFDCLPSHVVSWSDNVGENIAD